MNITNTLYITNRKDWRKWLREHYKTEKDIWLICYRKETGKRRIEYNAAVEEALCFGWTLAPARVRCRQHPENTRQGENGAMIFPLANPEARILLPTRKDCES